MTRRPVNELETLERLRLDPVMFADTFLPRNEKGQSWRLSPTSDRCWLGPFAVVQRVT
jgi:hypothetical protein